MDNIKWFKTSSRQLAIGGTLVENVENDGINWTWKSLSKVSKSDTKKDVYFAWQFEWDELKKQGIEGFEGTITVSGLTVCFHDSFPLYLPGLPKTFSVQLTRSGQWVEHCIGSEKEVGKLFNRRDIFFKCDFDIKPIKENDESHFLDETFAASDKTDAILVVEGKKLHVNRQFLSFHSEYFNKLFNSESKETSMDGIPIEGVDYENFARFLSVIYPNPLFPTAKTFQINLELADRFMMPKVSHLVELLLIHNGDKNVSDKIALADKYSLEKLLKLCLDSMKTTTDIKKITELPYFEELSDATKLKLFYKTISLL